MSEYQLNRRHFLGFTAATTALVLSSTNALAARRRRTPRAVVIDISDGETFRAGFSTSKRPTVELTALLGKRERSPLRQGAVIDPKAFEGLLRKVYARLKVAPGAQPLVFIEAPIYSKAAWATLAQIAFKRLGVPRLAITNAAVAALKTSGRSTGVVYFGAEDAGYVAAVKNGKLVPRGLSKTTLAGRDLTAYLQTLVNKRGIKIDKRTAKRMRDSVAAVAANFDTKLKQPGSKTFRTGGRAITIGAERFRAAEVMFKPSFIGKPKRDGIHRLTQAAIARCDKSLQPALYRNVVLAGGATSFPGIDERMEKEMKSLAPDSMTMKVVSSPDHQTAVFAGGVSLATLSTFEEMWIPRNKYDESGPGIVYRKCT